MTDMLSVTIQDCSFRDPDGDGDTRLEAPIRLRNLSDNPVALLLTRSWVRTPQGVVLCSNSEEREEPIAPGESSEFEADSGWIRAQLLSGADTAELSVDVLGCRSSFIRLPAVQLGEGQPGLYGSNQPLTPIPGIVLESLAISVAPADEDGDVRVEVRLLVRNSRDAHLPRIALKVQAVAANGRVLDDSSTEDAIRPDELKLLETSFYSLKENRLKGLEIRSEVTVFSIIDSVTASLQVPISMSLP